MPKPRRKYIFVVGGVMSSVGKGVASASIGKILQGRGYSVTAVKADPYVNVDAGTMNPTEHGEVFVTNDGDETDQDIGNYERFLDAELSSTNYMTTGRVYLSVIEKERNLDYRGKCVEVVPHIPEEIIDRIKKAAEKNKAEITIIEVGGTIGEYQNILFLEAARMMKLENPGDVIFVLVSYLPIPSKVGEMKTKPTQHASRGLNSAGIQADFIICRSEKTLDTPRRERLAIFCGIQKDHAVSAPDVSTIYEVPLNFEKEHLSDKILKSLRLPMGKKRNMEDWKKLVNTIKNSRQTVKIGIVGKYFRTGKFTLIDSYISVIESLKHAAWYHKHKLDVHWIDSQDFEDNASTVKKLAQYDGILVPGGFGSRGVEGKIRAIKFVREHGIPYFGLCYGMQMATIEFARNVANLKNANTLEVDPKTPHDVITINKTQRSNIEMKKYGGSMRLGAYRCKITPKSFVLFIDGRR